MLRHALLAFAPRWASSFRAAKGECASLEFDRTVKLPLYAEAGIRELWIVNLPDERLEVYRQPQQGGTYAQTSSLQSGEAIEPLAFPNLRLAVSEILP